MIDFEDVRAAQAAVDDLNSPAAVLDAAAKFLACWPGIVTHPNISRVLLEKMRSEGEPDVAAKAAQRLEKEFAPQTPTVPQEKSSETLLLDPKTVKQTSISPTSDSESPRQPSEPDPTNMFLWHKVIIVGASCLMSNCPGMGCACLT